MHRGLATALKALYIVLLGHYHTISDRYTLTPIASTRIPPSRNPKREKIKHKSIAPFL